jgi:hypothetical protein
VGNAPQMKGRKKTGDISLSEIKIRHYDRLSREKVYFPIYLDFPKKKPILKNKKSQPKKAGFVKFIRPGFSATKSLAAQEP